MNYRVLIERAAVVPDGTLLRATGSVAVPEHVRTWWAAQGMDGDVEMYLTEADTAAVLDGLAAAVHENAVARGFWEGATDTPEALGLRLALMHAELSEALEAAREGNPPDAHLPQYPALVVELADCLIRILDTAAGLELPIGAAVRDKLAYNRGRPYKHGRLF